MGSFLLIMKTAAVLKGFLSASGVVASLTIMMIIFRNSSTIQDLIIQADLYHTASYF